MIEKMVLATHNKGKVAEFQVLLDGVVGEILCAGDLGLPEPEETGTTFIENATIKAMAAMQASGLPALADDSGLCVDALSGAPGVYSADWAGNPRDFEKAMNLVRQKMGDAANKGAAFVSVLVLAWPDGKTMHAEGRVEGDIVWPPRGAGGFGYDPMFQPTGYDQTFGEMPSGLKNTLSHRKRAVAVLKSLLLSRP